MYQDPVVGAQRQGWMLSSFCHLLEAFVCCDSYVRLGSATQSSCPSNTVETARTARVVSGTRCPSATARNSETAARRRHVEAPENRRGTDGRVDVDVLRLRHRIAPVAPFFPECHR